MNVPSVFLERGGQCPPHESLRGGPRVVLVAGAGAMDAPGGGEIQMLATAEALSAAGVEVRLADDAECRRGVPSPPTSLPQAGEGREIDPLSLWERVRVRVDSTRTRTDPGTQLGAETDNPFGAETDDPLRAETHDETHAALLSRAEVLHLFGSRREFVPIAEAARRQSVPVALSTIAWFDLASYWRAGSGLLGRAAAFGRFAARAVSPSLPSWRRRLYHAADVLLPNSQAEAEQLIRYFRVPPERIHIVPNGAEPRFGQADAEPFAQRFGLRDFVLCAGRIEPRKNQLGLIRALRGTGLRLVVLGDAVPGHEVYAARCRREAGPEVVFLGRIDHDNPLLASAYAASACLALASWFETPGLVALEAAMSGTPLVLPEAGAARQYFGDHAEYVRPGDLGGIRRAVLRAIRRGRSPALAEFVQADFTWVAAAWATLDAYRKIL